MTTLHIDFESRSSVDIRRAGVYVYAEHPSTDIWCAAYALDDEPVGMWLPGEPCPTAVTAACAEGWTVIAHNANFERVMWGRILATRYGWPQPRLEQWRCTMAMAMAMALPGSLEGAAAALGLEHTKDMEGHGLMLRMASPRRPRKGENPDGVFWFDDEPRKQRLYAYCRQDVEVERQLERRLLALRPSELRLWHLDQTINDRGVYVDTELCRAALQVVETSTRWLNDELRELTGGFVRAASNVAQLTAWLEGRGIRTPSLDKVHIEALLGRGDLTEDVRRCLEIRQEAAKAAVKKIDALLAGMNADGRARGLLQYHAASTGRWAGRRFQPQNIKRPDIKDVDSAIAAVASGSADLVRILYDQPLAVVGDCLRGMVRAPAGRRLIAADFSNIEGRVLAWLAGEQWKCDAFSAFDRGEGPDIYRLAYARAFGIPVGGVDDDGRQVGKVMELALGYQGGVGAFQTMAVGYRVSVSDERADEIKVAWRDAHPAIVQFWWDLDRAAQQAVQAPGIVYRVGALAFRRAGSFLFLRLPSGRTLCYPYPRVADREVPWGGTRPAVVYKGVDSYTRRWQDCWAYGGLWAENVTQAVARDVMAEAMGRVEAAGYPVVLTVHDEVVSEINCDFGSLSEFEALMVELPSWADGLPVAAKAWSAERYRK